MSSKTKSFDIKESQRFIDVKAKEIKGFRQTLNAIRKEHGLRRRDALLQRIPVLRGLSKHF